MNLLPLTAANPHNLGLENRSLRSSGRGSRKALCVAAFAVFVLGLAMQQESAAQNIINTYVGGGTLPPGGAAPSSVDLPGPTAAIRDSSGNTYIAAPYSTYVFRLGSNGLVTTAAGSGYGGYNGDGGPASASVLALPTGLAFDSKGNIYIIDPGNPRVREITIATGKITTVAGNGTRCEPNTAACGDGGPATAANFNLPQSAAFDSTGNLYVADAFDNRIRVVNMQSTAITVFNVLVQPGAIATVAGSVGVSSNQCPNPTSACGDGGPALSALLYFPESVAFDSAGNLYIADTRDNRIRMVNPSGTISTVVGTGAVCLAPAKGCGDGGSATTAKMHFPTFVLLDSSNDIYIADSQDFRVREVSGGTIKTVAGNGNQGYSGDGGSATSAELNLPNSVFLDSTGDLIIADMGNQVVRQVSGGNISTIAGAASYVVASGGDGGPATSALLANPFNVGEDSAGNLYIADTANNRIRAVNTQATQITVYGVTIQPGDIATVAGNGTVGILGDGGPATKATLNGPTGVAIDTSGNLYIADAGNLVIRQVNSAGTINRYAGQYGISCPPSGSSCGIPGPALSATFSTPQAVAVDSAGNLYIIDYTKNQVREVTPGSPQMISNFAGTGFTGTSCVVKGQTKIPATSANLNHPSGIAVDSADNVYIDDSYANEVCKVTGGQLSLYTFNGAGHWLGDGGPALNAGQWNPLELSVDPGGNLFIGGGNNSCIRRVDSLTYTIGTVAGNIASRCNLGGFSGDGGPATSAKISPQGLVVDGQSNLYIADNANDRIRSVHLTPAVTLTPAKLNFGAWAIGQTSTPQTLTIQSSGGVDLSLTSFSPIGGADPGDFTQTGTTCGSTFPVEMGVDVTCTVTFTFTPATYGPRSATFTINDNASNSPQTVTLSGDGPYFTVNANPSSLTINPGSQGTSTITLTTYGGFSQTVSYTITGCPQSSTCTINPTQVTPPQSATLTVNIGSTTPAGSYTVTVKGTYGALQSWDKIPVTVP